MSRGVPVTGTNFADGKKIGVYGTETLGSTPTSNWMVNAELTRSTTNGTVSWDYSPTKFFKKGYAYSFVAYAPYKTTGAPDMSVTTAVPYQVATTLADQEDFMYAPVVSRPAGDTYANVKFTFQHALTQVLFTAKTKEDYSDYEIKVTSVKIPGLFANGTLDCTNSDCTWTTTGTATTEYVLPVNNVVLGTSLNDLTNADNHVLMLLPQSVADKAAVLTVTLTAKNGAPAIADPKEITVNFPAAGNEWKGGHGYKYEVTLNMDSILGWTTATFEDPDIVEWIFGNNIPMGN